MIEVIERQDRTDYYAFQGCAWANCATTGTHEVKVFEKHLIRIRLLVCAVHAEMIAARPEAVSFRFALNRPVVVSLWQRP